MQQLTIEHLLDTWRRVMGDAPDLKQFELWGEIHTPEVIHLAIIKTAIKNQKLGGQMSQDYREKFANRVMYSKTFDPQKAKGQSTAQPNLSGKEVYEQQ